MSRNLRIESPGVMHHVMNRGDQCGDIFRASCARAASYIGRRSCYHAVSGRKQNGSNQRSAAYTANNLNQYTQRAVPGYADLMGVSFATNTVVVGGQTAYRKGEYFRDQPLVSNSSSAV